MHAGKPLNPLRHLINPTLLRTFSQATDWELAAPDEVDNLLEDYQSLGVTLGAIRMEVLREQGLLGNSVTAEEMKQLKH